MGTEFTGECFVRVDILSEIEGENKWFYFRAQKSDELNPLFNMEILNDYFNKTTLQSLIKELENEQVQDNT